MATLIISEKRKAAEAIANALGTPTKIKKAKYLSIYYLKSRDIFVIPLRGHILEYKNTEKFKSWARSDPREIITKSDAIKKYPKSYAGQYIKALKEYGKKCNRCIIGTDADVEGCNIGLFDAVPFIRKANNDISLSQIWLSSLQKREIVRKFNNQIKPKWSWGETGEARAIIDAVIGFSATRELTITLKDLLKNINVKFLSIGRVQTSLLYLFYLRYKARDEFVPQPYWNIKATFKIQNTDFAAYHKENSFRKSQKKKAKTIYCKIEHAKFAHIHDIKQNKRKKSPPKPLNTSKALSLLTNKLKIRASDALNALQELYLNKLISYPRTDSDVYKSDFEHKKRIKNFSSHSQLGNYSSKLIQKNKFTPTKGKKDAGDHPPITPLKSVELNNSKLKTSIQKKVYNIIARHYLALFGTPTIELHQNIKLKIEKEPFIARHTCLIEKGFLGIAPFLSRKYDKALNLDNTDSIPIDKILLLEKKTQPPPRYSDTALLRLMEKNNLGTKSTRPTIIEILQKRKYIYQKGRSYDMTKLGVFLIENLKEIWLPFLKPNFTAYVEGLLEDIKKEKKKMDQVIEHVKNTFLKLFDKFRENKNEFVKQAEQFQKTNQNWGSKTRNKKFPQTTAKCPYCNQSAMKLVTTRNKKRFLACVDDDCIEKNNSYLSVPKYGKITILRHTFCSKCGFNVFKIYRRKNNKSFTYYMCPLCWNKGLEENNKGQGFCSSCKEYKIVEKDKISCIPRKEK
ncbi:MAG: DNA topoisomerase [Promethearchaeia archaeon]